MNVPEEMPEVNQDKAGSTGIITPSQQLLGRLGASELIVEQSTLRSSSDEYGALLGSVPTIEELVVTEGVLGIFAKKLPLDTSVENRRTRGKNLFGSLYLHVVRHHNPDARRARCSCCLRGESVVEPNQYRVRRWQYLEPFSLVAAYEANQLEDISITTGRKKKPLSDSVNYEILPHYIEALTA